jgi:hypothetical protein
MPLNSESAFDGEHIGAHVVGPSPVIAVMTYSAGPLRISRTSPLRLSRSSSRKIWFHVKS